MAVAGTIMVNVKANTAVFDQKLKKSSARLGAFGKTAKRAQDMIRGFGVALTGGAILYGFKRIIAMAAEQEQAERMLEAALTSTGQSAEIYGGKLKKLAADIQSVTTYGDEALMGLMAQALNLGVSADRMDDVTKAAIGMSTALKMDLGTALRYTALAMQGEFTMLRRYIPALREAKTAQEQLDIVNKMAIAGFAQAQEAAKTTAGSWKQFGNAIGDVAEKIGAEFLPVLTEMAQEMSKTMKGAGQYGWGTQLLKHIAEVNIALESMLPEWMQMGVTGMLAPKLQELYDAERKAAQGMTEFSIATDLATVSAKGFMAASFADEKYWTKQGEAVQAVIDKLKDERETFGMSAREVALYRVSKGGLTEENWNLISSLNAELDVMDKLAEAAKERRVEAERTAEAIKGEAKSIFEATRNPIERMQASLAGLNALLTAGALDYQTYIRAVAQAQIDAISGMEQPTVEKVSGVGQFQGIDRAFMDIAGMGNMGQDIDRKQLTELEKQTKELKRIASGGGLGAN